MTNESKIQEELADAIIETEEIRELKSEIEDKRNEIADNEEWELTDSDFDEELDGIYPEVEIAGHKYSTSNALKNVDECLYEQMRMEMEDDLRLQKAEELEDELDLMEEELEELYGENEEDEE